MSVVLRCPGCDCRLKSSLFADVMDDVDYSCPSCGYHVTIRTRKSESPDDWAGGLPGDGGGIGLKIVRKAAVMVGGAPGGSLLEKMALLGC